MEQVQKGVGPPQPQRTLRAGILQADLIADIIEAVPSLSLADVRYLSPLQVSSFTRTAAIRRTRRNIESVWQQHSGGEKLENEYRAMQRHLNDLLFEPQALPERARRQQEEFEERKRKGETYAQRKSERVGMQMNPPPKRGRFSIRKHLKTDDTPQARVRARIQNAELPKGIRGL